MNTYDVVRTEKVGAFTIEIVPDMSSFNPFDEWDWEGIALCLNFGRNGELKTPNCKKMKPNDLLRLVKPDPEEDSQESPYKGWHIFPVYAYIHSGITVSLGAFGDPWDSGCCGYVALAPKMFPGKEEAYVAAKATIETADDYLTGNVYGWAVKGSDGETVESEWGYFGDPEKSGCLQDARNCAKDNEATAELHTSAQALD